MFLPGHIMVVLPKQIWPLLEHVFPSIEGRLLRRLLPQVMNHVELLLYRDVSAFAVVWFCTTQILLLLLLLDRDVLCGTIIFVLSAWALALGRQLLLEAISIDFMMVDTTEWSSCYVASHTLRSLDLGLLWKLFFHTLEAFDTLFLIVEAIQIHLFWCKHMMITWYKSSASVM